MSSQHRTRIHATITALCVFLVVTADDSRADGERDPAFGSNSIAAIEAGVPIARSAGIARLPNGKIVIVGHTTTGDVVVSRLRVNGALDPTFGTDGVVLLHLGGKEEAVGVAVQRDGKILVATTRTKDGRVEFALARLTTVGTLDASFNDSGKRVLDFGSSAESRAGDIALQIDGRIVVVGTRTNSSGSVFAIARLLPDGSFDASFAGNGKRVVDFGTENGNDASATAVAVQDDGGIVVAGSLEGSAGTSFALARLTPEGDLDETLDGNGKVVTEFGADAFAEAVTVWPTGRIVAAGTRRGSDDDFAVAVYTRRGQLDERFSGNGKISIDFAADESARDIVLQPDGAIVVVGTRVGGGGTDFAVARYLSDGTPDSTLDGDGKLRIDLFPDDASTDEGAGVALLPTGQILVGGASTRGEATALVAMRLLSKNVTPKGLLEVPGDGSDQSGIGLLSGWVCDARGVSIVLDGAAAPLRTAYGTPRNDTATTCGDTNNGFSLLFNWSILGDGFHIARGLADGVEFGLAVFQVATLGERFIRGAEGDFLLTGFPENGDTFRLVWKQSLQRFVVADAVSGPASTPPTGSQPSQPAAVVGVLENPAKDSAQSGIGIISGWVCDANQIVVRIDSGPPEVAGYGPRRDDTIDACGDRNNGFGLLLNWGRLGDGLHDVVVFADGEVLDTARFTVTTFGVPFLRDADGQFTLGDFPELGDEVDVDWDRSQQGFVVTDYRAAGS